MSKLAVYPGSFDPFTLGHLDVARRAANIFDQVLLLVVHNPSKQPTFDSTERVEMVKRVIETESLPNVHVKQLPSGLLTEYCKLLGADVIVKGLRNASDLAGELPQANVNRDLSGIETLYLPSDPTLSYVSSSLVRQVAELGGDITKYVPASIAETYARKLRND